MVCIGTPSLCLEKVIIAAAHIPQTSADGNADLAAVDALSPGDFRLLDTGNVVGVNTAGLCRSGMSQSRRQSCNQVQAGGHFFSFQQNIFRRSAVFQCVIFQPAVCVQRVVGAVVDFPTLIVLHLPLGLIHRCPYLVRNIHKLVMPVVGIHPPQIDCFHRLTS